MEENYFKILTDLHVFSGFMVCHLCACVCVCASLVHEQFRGLYSYSVFNSSSILGQCAVNTNTPATKTGAFQMGPKTQNDNYLKNISNDSD